MGKNNKTPQPPEIQAKSLGQIQSEAVTANIESLPKMLQAYQQYGPEFTKVLTQQFIDAQKRAPEAFPELYKILEPLTEVVSTRLGKASAFSKTGDMANIPDFLLTPYQTLLRNSQAARGVADSPVSAYNEANYLLPYAEDYIGGIIGEGNSLAGTLNTLRSVPTGVSVTPESLGLSNPDINQSMQLEGQTLQPFREEARQQNYATQLAYRQNQANKKSQTAKVIGGAVGAVGGPFVGLDPFTGAQVGSTLGGTFF